MYVCPYVCVQACPFFSATFFSPPKPRNLSHWDMVVMDMVDMDMMDIDMVDMDMVFMDMVDPFLLKIF